MIDHPIYTPEPHMVRRDQLSSSNGQRLSVSIGIRRQARRPRHGRDARAIHQTDHPPRRAAPDRAACRLDHLRDGAARRIPPPLCPYDPMRGLGSQRSGSLAGRAQTSHGKRLDAARASPRRPQAPKPPHQSAGSGTSIGIDGGMRTGRCFRPATQASMISAHSCIMCRR